MVLLHMLREGCISVCKLVCSSNKDRTMKIRILMAFQCGELVHRLISFRNGTREPLAINDYSMLSATQQGTAK